MRQTAKLFTNGGSQAVRLPAEFRLAGTEVFIRKDPDTGEVVLTEKPQTWDAFFAARDAAAAAGELDEDFLDLEERKRQLPRPDPFADLDE
ncbi:MAG: AbrB/MazE/SpoVT family DNA-binding domain-containing protein [Thermomicrobiales bacterium]|nr:AbrB/MazE/SpoVT family DNA-binding domain-containing protein [Thermomicrobiales bacterium]